MHYKLVVSNNLSLASLKKGVYYVRSVLFEVVYLVLGVFYEDDYFQLLHGLSF